MSILPPQPPAPNEAVTAQEQYLRKSEALLAQAQTAEERAWAMFCIDNADRNLTKWRAVAERGAR